MQPSEAMSKRDKLPSAIDLTMLSALEIGDIEQMKAEADFADAMSEKIHPRVLLALLELVPPQEPKKTKRGRPASVINDRGALRHGQLIVKAIEQATHGRKRESFRAAAKELGLSEGTAQRRRDMYRRRVEEFKHELIDDESEAFFARLRAILGDPVPLPLYEEWDDYPAEYANEFNEELRQWEARNAGGKHVLKRLPVPKKKR